MIQGLIGGAVMSVGWHVGTRVGGQVLKRGTQAVGGIAKGLLSMGVAHPSWATNSPLRQAMNGGWSTNRVGTIASLLDPVGQARGLMGLGATPMRSMAGSFGQQLGRSAIGGARLAPGLAIGIVKDLSRGPMGSGILKRAYAVTGMAMAAATAGEAFRRMEGERTYLGTNPMLSSSARANIQESQRRLDTSAVGLSLSLAGVQGKSLPDMYYRR